MDPQPEKLMEVLNKGTTENTKCPRIVRRHKYERLTQNNQIWWNNKFKELEANIRTPWHKKFSELKNVFTRGELKSLQAAGLTYDDDENEEKYYRKKRRASSVRRRTTFASNIYIPRRRASLPVKKDYMVDRLIDFFKKAPEEVKVWSPKQKRDLANTVHLLERAAIVEEELAEDFDKWFNNIKTYTTSEINKETILNIFEINSSLAIHNAIVVNMQLMRSVPDQVAKYLGEPELASSVVLKRQIDSDIKASKIKPINIAFNKMLPPDMRKYKHVSDNKIKITSDYKELETFAAVFKDIMDLETSKRFVSWLRNHPEVPPPPFLQKSYMVSRRKTPKRSMFIRQIYEAKVWGIDTHSRSNSSDKQNQQSNPSLTGSSREDSYSTINFLV